MNLNQETKLDGIHGSVGELLLDVDTKASQSFQIKLRSSAKEETILSYDNGIFKVDRYKSGVGPGGMSEVQLAPSDKLKMQIFLDKSSVEVFLNDGEAVISTRIYPDESSQDIVFIPNGNLKIDNAAFYTLDKGLE